MAARLTDKQKKKIISDYIESGSYNATAKKHKVSATTVKKIVEADKESAKKCEQKKRRKLQKHSGAYGKQEGCGQ